MASVKAARDENQLELALRKGRFSLGPSHPTEPKAGSIDEPW